jgi:phosphoribosyl-ATP pyrophosphohydrolase/phosphoribosyl-AMP cyclohydrolase
MKINFNRNTDGLVPAIIQDAVTNKVLMLGYMDEAALSKTLQEGRVSFYSRSRNSIWTKGETSGNYLLVKEMFPDCDRDTLLIKATPTGPVCHTGQDTCFNEINNGNSQFLFELEEIIEDRKVHPKPKSYTSHLFRRGKRKIAQKVGEEATEVVIEALENRQDRLKEESADLIYHLLVLLSYQEIELNDILNLLEKRHKR